MPEPRPERLTRRLEKMVAAGRLTEQEADRVVGATDDADLEAARREIRTRHFLERLALAVQGGQVSEDERDRILDRLAGGEDPHALRRLLRADGRDPVERRAHREPDL